MITDSILRGMRKLSGGDAMRHNDDRAMGGVVFSVELELAIDRPALHRQQRLDRLSGELIGLFERHQLPATWAVADPARSAATAAIAASALRHEVAVLGESSWLGRGAGRLRIERELARRIGGARQAGIAVSTLLLRNVSEPLDLDLLLEQQISAVSYSGMASPPSQRSGDRHFGVWHAPAAWRLPLAPHWWQPVRWQAARRLWQASRRQRIEHVAIDGDALVDQGERGLAQIAAIVKLAAKLRAERKLSVRTLAEIAAENLSHRFPQPAKSVLASAA